MKTLTDKIIDKLNAELIVFYDPADPEGLKAFNNGIKKAILIIKEEEKSADFEEIARQLMKHMAEKYHPHHSVIITSTNAELLEGKKSTGHVMDYVPD